MTDADREIEYCCGCCGEWYEECLCPGGPTDSFREFLARRENGACVGYHEISEVHPEDVELAQQRGYFNIYDYLRDREKE